MTQCGGVDQPSAMTLTIVLDRQADPVAGTVRSGDGVAAQAFVGWVDLIQAVERLRVQARTAEPPP